MLQRQDWSNLHKIANFWENCLFTKMQIKRKRCQFLGKILRKWEMNIYLHLATDLKTLYLQVWPNQFDLRWPNIAKDLVTISPSKLEYEDPGNMSVSIYSNTKIDIIAAKIGHIYPISNQNVKNLNQFLNPNFSKDIETNDKDQYWGANYFWFGNFLEISKI